MASSASIPHAALESVALAAPWSHVMPWSAVAFLGAVLGATAFTVGSLPLVALGALIAGVAGTKGIVLRRRRVRLQRDRIVDERALGSTELRFTDITSIRCAGLLAAQKPLAPERLTYAGATGDVSFSDLEPGGAAVLSHAVLRVVVPRLVEELAARVRAGEDVRFGSALTATREGLQTTACAMAWDEIERVDATPNGVRIFAVDRPDRVITVPVTTDNAVLLDPLVRRLQTGAPRAAGAAHVEGWASDGAQTGALVCGVDKTPPRAWLATTAIFLATLAASPLAGDVAALVAMLGVLGAGVSAIVTGVKMRRAFAVYERGVANRRHFLAFDDVVSLSRSIVDQYANGGYVGRNVTLVLVGKDGTRLRLHGHGDRIEAVAAAVVRRALPVLVERARSNIAKGGALRAGPLRVDDKGLCMKGDKLAWDDIDTAVVEGGALHIWQKGVGRSVIALGLDRKDALVALEIIAERLAARPQSAARDLFSVDALVEHRVEEAVASGQGSRR